jgi:hypothetical protein
MLFYSRIGYKKHLAGKKEQLMENPEVSREMGIASDNESLHSREMEFCLLDCLVLGTVNVTGEVDLTELVLKVHLLTVCELSPLCILGAQK